MKNRMALPAKIFNLYIMFTLSISIFGPMKYKNYNTTIVVIYILLFLVFFNAGVYLSKRYSFVLVRNRKKPTNIIYNRNTLDKRIRKILVYSLNIALFALIVEFIGLIQSGSIASFANISSNYYITNSSSMFEEGYSVTIIVRFMTGVFRNISLILFPFYWSSVDKRTQKKYWLFILLLVIVNLIGYGTQKFVGDLIIYTAVSLYAKSITSSKKYNRKIVRLVICFFLIALSLFVVVQSQRYREIGITASNYGLRSDGNQYFDVDNIVFRIFGDNLGLGLAILLTGYLSSGYYGLSLALQLPFKWSFGLGNSYFISKSMNLILGFEDFYFRTYLHGLTTTFNRDGLRTWNTIFPWLASDFTFTGTLFIFMIIGFVWQKLLVEVVNYQNPISLLLYSTITLGLIYVPANNQLFNAIETFIPTVLIILMYVSMSRKYNFTLHDRSEESV